MNTEVRNVDETGTKPKRKSKPKSKR
jgi:hypothetical protein